MEKCGLSNKTKIFFFKIHKSVTETHILLKPKNIKSRNPNDLYGKKLYSVSGISKMLRDFFSLMIKLHQN